MKRSPAEYGVNSRVGKEKEKKREENTYILRDNPP